MISAILGRLGGPYLAVALFALAAVLGIQTVRLAGAKADLAGERTQRANERAAAAQALALEQARIRETEQRWQATVEVERKGLEDAKRKNAELADAIGRMPAVDVGSLRNQLSAARGAAATTSLAAAAACDLRAGAYEALLADGSRLLAEGVTLAGNIARAHDDRAAEVTALLKAWPK